MRLRISVLGAAWLGTLLLAVGILVILGPVRSKEDLAVAAILAAVPSLLTIVVGGVIQAVRKDPSMGLVAATALAFTGMFGAAMWVVVGILSAD